MDVDTALRVLNLIANYGTLFALGALAYSYRGGKRRDD